jgi:glycosyltransferase family protein
LRGDVKYKISNEYDTIQTILVRKASLGRFGDGELRVCIGGKIKSQDYNYKLKKRLIEVLGSNYFNFLIGVPRVFYRRSHYPSEFHWRKFFTRSKIRNLLEDHKQYYSSFISRVESAPNIINRDYWDLVKQLWQGRDIVIVEGEHNQFSESCKQSGFLKGAASITILKCASKNAFNHYYSILEQCLHYPKASLFVLSLGATATVLAYDLFSKGRQALDVGRLGIHYNRIKEMRFGQGESFWSKYRKRYLAY